MERDNGEDKLRIEFSKKVRPLCNFCEVPKPRFELRPHEQDHGAVGTESELERLRLVTRRMTGKDLEGLSFSELLLLESRLKDVLVIVKDQQKKVELEEDERMCKQKQDGKGRELSAPCNFFGSSSEERPQKQDDEEPVMSRLERAFETRNAESMQSEFERLWLLNERMNGRELDGMTLFELLLLEGQILDGINSVKDQKLEPRMEQIARQRKEELISLSAEQERCSLDTVKDNHHRDISLRFRSQRTFPCNSRRIEFSKKVRPPCNFCEVPKPRFELRPHEQDHEAVGTESELERLRLVTRRMTGKDLEGLSFSELPLLESQLQDVLVIVTDQQKKVKLEEDERMCKQKQEAGDEDDKGRELSAPCKFFGSSSEGRPQKQDDEEPVMSRLQRAFETQNAESMQSEFERLWLLNERMNGRELDGMTFFELLLLEVQILDGMNSLQDQMARPRLEEIARQRKEESISLSVSAEQERCSLDIVKDDHHRDIPLRLRSPHTLPSASRKLRRFQNRKIRSVCQSQVVTD